MQQSSSDDSRRRGQKFRFFKFPRHDKEPDRRNRWALACGRVIKSGSVAPWQPPDHVKGVYICSEHFITGAPVHTENHPDYVPSVNLGPPKPKDRNSSERPGRDEQKLRRYASAVKRKFKVLPPTTQKASKVRRSDSTGQDLGDSLPSPDDSQIQLAECGADDSDHAEFDVDPQQSSATASHTAPTIEPVFIGESVQKMVFEEVAALERERDRLKKELDLAKARLNSVRLSCHIIVEKPEKCQFYTGLSWDVFQSTYDVLAAGTLGKGVPIISYMDQFFVTLVKLKHDLKFEYMADHIGISKSAVIDIFWKWIDIIVNKLDWMIQWPDRDRIHKVIPPHFKSLYPKLTCIIDCFEIFVEAPSNLKARAQLWSNYKKHTTIKYLIGCNSVGAVSFLSRAWGGRASDVEIVRQSRFMTRPEHAPGDQVLADRGFTLQDVFAALAGVELIIPAFIKGQTQFTAQEVETSRQISSVRIQIERVIGGIKNRFAILQGTLTLRLIKSLKEESDEADLTSADKLVQACSILYNLQPSIVYNE